MQLTYFKTPAFFNSSASFLTEQLLSEHAGLYRSFSFTTGISFNILLTKYIYEHFTFSLFTWTATFLSWQCCKNISVHQN